MISADELGRLDSIMSAATGGTWEWQPHGDGWALMTGCQFDFGDGKPAPVHGLNLLTVGAGGFCWNGESNRAAIAAIHNAWPAIRDALLAEVERQENAEGMALERDICR
jgi:hypothetical protein